MTTLIVHSALVYIDAKATFCDLNDGKKIGERIYNTSSTAWAGIFATRTPGQIDAIGHQVFAEGIVLQEGEQNNSE